MVDMSLEMQVNRRISSSGSSSSGAFGSSASSASAQPLPFYAGNSAVNSYRGNNLAQASADGSTPNLAYRINQHIYVPEKEAPQDDNLDAVKEESGGTQGMFSRIGHKLKNKSVAAALAAYFGLSALAYGASQAIFPQFADGAGYRTRIVVTNPTRDPSDTRQQTITLKFLGGQNGDGIPVNMKGSSAMSSTYTYTLKPNSTLEVETSGFGPTANSGYIILASDNPASTIIPALTYFTPNDSAVSVGKSNPLQEQHVYVKKTLDAITRSVENTGLALANPDTSRSVSVTMYLLDSAGQEVSKTQEFLGPGQHLAKTADGYFRILNNNDNFRGTINISTDAPVYATALGFNSLGSLWAVPAGGGSYNPNPLKDVNVTINAIDVVDFLPLPGNTTITLGNQTKVTGAGSATFSIKPGTYEANVSNSGILPDLQMIKETINGPVKEKKDAGESSMPVNVAESSTESNYYVLTVLKNFIGDKNTRGDPITEAYFRDNFGCLPIKRFADTANIQYRYRNLTNNPDVIVKANNQTFVDWFNAQYYIRNHKLKWQDGGNLQLSNYIDVWVNDRGPVNGNHFSGTTLIDGIIQHGSDTATGTPAISRAWDVVGEEGVEAVFDFNTTPNRVFLFEKVNTNGPTNSSRAGKTVLAFADQVPAGMQVKKCQ